MHNLTHSHALQSTVQFLFYSLMVACLFFVPSLLVAGILSVMGLA